MTEDFVVSCWPVPKQKRGQSITDWNDVLVRVAVGCHGFLFVTDGVRGIAVHNTDLKAYPGDTICQTASGQMGIKRGK